MFCPKCGKQTDDGTAFCGGCGTPLQATTGSQANTGAEHGSSLVVRRSKAPLVVGAVVVVAVVVALVLLVLPGNPIRVPTRVVSYDNDGTSAYEAIYEYDSAGNLLSKDQQNQQYGLNRVSSFETFAYDRQGFIISSEEQRSYRSLDGIGGDGTTSYETSYENQIEDNRLISAAYTTTTTSDRSSSETEGEEVFTYSEDGALETWDSKNQSARVVFSFDEFGLPKSINDNRYSFTVDKESGLPLLCTKASSYGYQYDYDEAGNLIAIKSVSASSKNTYETTFELLDYVEIRNPSPGARLYALLRQANCLIGNGYTL